MTTERGVWRHATVYSLALATRGRRHFDSGGSF
jgi:hypothetical protein